MTAEAGVSSGRSKAVLLTVFPIAAVAVNLMVWVTGLSRSGFWADDFLNLTSFNRTFGELSNDHINKGKYVINAFWALGTDAFGLGSVVPFLLLNGLILTAGVALWLWLGSRHRWGAVEAWWVGALFLCTAAWLPTALWSSNITHSCGFLALGIAAVAHERCMAARTLRAAQAWSLLGGAAWTFALISNLIYLGLLAIAAYFTFHQVLKLRRFGVAGWRAGGMTASWNLVAPLVYFAAIGYPATTESSTYGGSGFSHFRGNYDFYKFLLAPSTILVVAYGLIIAGAAAGAFVCARRRDWFPLAVLAAAVATAMPALLQGQQRDIHYLAMPLLLLFSALAAGVRPLLASGLPQVGRLRGALFAVALVSLVLIFRQGADTRAFFVNTPYGSQLTTFRSQVAALTPAAGALCVKLALDPQHQALLNAEMSGAAGFVVPPIAAAQVYLFSSGERCPSTVPASTITVSLDARGDFIAGA
jgi:hypothetical protein